MFGYLTLFGRLSTLRLASARAFRSGSESNIRERTKPHTSLAGLEESPLGRANENAERSCSKIELGRIGLNRLEFKF